ncbi:MAG TPA: D-aminoacylase [Gemmatimonadaceae bacterium]|nr:D-aminoacylase [Gemmatimonadaceae bacterium]
MRSSVPWRAHTALLPLALVLAAACGAAPRGAVAPSYDLLVAGGMLVDGSGAPAMRADVAIVGDRIVAVSLDPMNRHLARRVIDATGRIVAPGFVDLHAHLDPLATMPDAESHVRQGVTTALGGPDGSSPAPLAEYLAAREREGVGMNVAYLVGHGTVRRSVMGMARRAPTADELARMRALVEREMAAGAFGLSTGLKYVPAAWATIDEVVAMSEVVGRAGGIYTSHLREEGLGLLEGVREAIEIGRRARLPIVLTHHKAVGTPMWGRSVETLALVDSARAQGVEAWVDVYPYTATHTGISVLVPEWAFDGGDSAFARRVREPALRDSIVRGIVFNLLNDRGGGDLRRVQFSRFRAEPSLEGRTLHDWAVRRGFAPTPENGAALVIEAITRGGANAIYNVLDEGDVRRILAHPRAMVASDGRLSAPGDGHPHPRAYGTFPRVLARYVRTERLIPLEEAVRKMTSMPAARLGLRDRGVVRVGAYADLVVFDAATVADRATFEAPHQYPVGIDWVIVNGRPAVEAGRFVGGRAGKVLRRTR